ncbi:MAG: HEAT repeat domain-containing protein [Promethearchaeota archaeon]
MAKKDDETADSSSDDDKSASRFRKAVRATRKKKDDFIGKMLANLESIQACKDAALTGDDDTRLLAVCRLGEFGSAAFDALDISLIDDNPMVRIVAAGMLAYSEDVEAIGILKPFADDEDEIMKETIGFLLEWLGERATEKDHGTQIPDDWEASTGFLVDSDATPLKTSDDVAVVSSYTSAPESLEFGIAIGNNSLGTIREVSVKVLNYPKESLEPLDTLNQIIEKIEPNGFEALIFGFKAVKESVEGEFVTSVHFVDPTGEKIAAISGNIFVRSLFEQLSPLEATPEEFLSFKSDMKEWNREHSLIAEATDLFGTLMELFKDWNFHIVQSENTEREDVFMGVVSGLAEGRISNNKIAVTLTVVGRIKDELSKLRIDVLSEDPEILHTVASVLFESVQRKLGVIEAE